MNKIYIICCFFCMVNVGFCANWEMEKTYNIDDGRTYTISYSGKAGPRVSIATIKDSDGNVVSRNGHDLDYIVVDDEGNVLSSEKYVSSDITYITNTSGQIIGKKSSWEGPLVETYKYTETGKLLVYGPEGNFIGIYNDFVDREANTTAGESFYSASKTGITKYVGDLNLINEDGIFEDYDENHKLLGVYYTNGDIRTRQYSKNGDYMVYDGDGNNLGNFMADGSKRRIYAIDEAVAVTEKGAKNRFVLRYR